MNNEQRLNDLEENQYQESHECYQFIQDVGMTPIEAFDSYQASSDKEVVDWVALSARFKQSNPDDFLSTTPRTPGTFPIFIVRRIVEPAK